MQLIGHSTKAAGNALKPEWDFHLQHVDFPHPVPSCINARPGSRGGYGAVIKLTRGWRVTICRRGKDPGEPAGLSELRVTVHGDNLDATFAAAIELLSSRVAPREYVSVHELMGGSWYTPRDPRTTPPLERTIEPMEGE